MIEEVILVKILGENSSNYYFTINKIIPTNEPISKIKLLEVAIANPIILFSAA